MFDSIEGGIIPICIVAALFGAFFARIRNPQLGVFLASLSAILVSYCWFWIPDLISSTPSTDSLRGWDLAVTLLWSAFAIPSALFILIAVRQQRRSKNRGMTNQNHRTGQVVQPPVKRSEGDRNT